MELNQLSASKITNKIRADEVSCTEVVKHFISRIEKTNPTINAVVEDRFAKAREQAKAQDQQLAKLSKEQRKELPPLFGVPCTIKEMISVEGMKSTLGSIHRREKIMSRDATVVERLKKAGANILGTTNVPEVGFWFESDNVVYGRTNNPFDPKRTSGGSSGGEGAILGAGGSVFGIGSDIGGSVRLPAAFCGVFGHKPSDRVIPFTGHVPIYHDNAALLPTAEYPFTVLGPMARHASDLDLLMKIVSGPDGFDKITKTDFKEKSMVTDASKIRVHYLPSPIIHGTTETEREISQSVIHAARYLKEMGSKTQELPEKIFLHGFDFWTGRAWSVENKNFPNYLTDGNKIHFAKEFLNLAIGRRNYTLPSLLTAFMDTYASDRSGKEDHLAGLARLKIQLEETLRHDGILIMPVHPRKAPKHNSTISRPFDFSYTGIFNALGFPATAVPMGLSADGLPLSVQVVAAEDQDHLCISVAQMLETGFGGALTAKI